VPKFCTTGRTLVGVVRVVPRALFDRESRKAVTPQLVEF
jgi:hypothetical protein